MTQQTRNCPDCGGVMHYRLGEYQCGSCPHSEPAAAPVEEHTGHERTTRREAWQPGPGVRSSSEHKYTGALIQPHDSGPEAPQPPPPPPSYAPADGYGAGASASSYPGDDSFTREKNMFFIIFCALQGLSIAGLCVFLVMLPVISTQLAQQGAANTPDAAALRGAVLFLIIVMLGATIISIALVRWVLFGDSSCAKWGCLVLVAIGTLGTIAQIFRSMGPSGEVYQYLPATGIVRAIVTLSLLLQLAWQAWYISIVYRDIQRVS